MSPDAQALDVQAIKARHELGRYFQAPDAARDIAALLDAYEAKVRENAALRERYEQHDVVCNSDHRTPPSCSCLGRARRERDALTAALAEARKALETIRDCERPDGAAYILSVHRIATDALKARKP